MKTEEIKNLIEIANEAKENAYAPFSDFPVGAALITDKGNIYTGINVENSSYGLGNCAERTAVFKAVSEEGPIKIKAIAIVSKWEDFVYPCGACRQVLYEFGDENTKVICSNNKGEYKIHNLDELLPYAFKFSK